ncbi:MAG: SRPBCC domain-containing protein [Acidimicrobiia bacterium]
MASTEVTVTVAASRAAVCECFTDPFAMVRWMGVDVVLDPNAGGELRVEVNGRDVAVGEFVEVEPPEHLQFTWGWEGSTDCPPGSSTVDVTFTAGDDGTTVRLHHAGLTDEQAQRHTAGWRHYLDRLAVAAPGGDPGRDPWLDQAH